ncbi:hypothetical protein H5410_016014 [Solanum commersonii]|uniref:Uncharacterized protein n=1 Tax=Solanum commersonii TaxID=4109 RepID=A0A9J5ZVA1_SOLCO|nr:hypothetical protein H5410_016014 [Solanum commersonii]
MAEELDQKRKIASLRREKDYLLMKVGMLEATQKFTLEAKKLEIWFLKQKLDEVVATMKFYSGVFRALEREIIDLKVKLEEQNQLTNKLVKELQAEASELENKLKIHDDDIFQSLIDENKQELDQKRKIASLRREKDFLLMKVGMLEATQKFTLEAKKFEIWFLKQNLDEVDSTVKFYSVVFRALERENIDLKVKVEEQNQLKNKLAK